MTATFKSIVKNPGFIRNITGNYITPQSSDLKLVLVPISATKTQTGTIYNTVSKRWSSVDSKFREWYVSQKKFENGNIADIMVQTDTMVILVIANDEISYRAALGLVSKFAISNKASVHIPDSFLESCSLDLLTNTVVNSGVNLTIYKSN